MFSLFSLSRAIRVGIPSPPPSRRTCISIANRTYSVVTAPPRKEHFDVPCRSNGSIRVDVYHALDAASPVLIYLPPGPVVPHNPEADEGIIAALRASSAATVVRINYRASSQHQFPTPYHDVLYGFDWIQDNLLLDASQKPYAARLGICGELMGGSIATMLALTECRVGESRIVAAAVNNPVADWVFPDDLPHVSAPELPEPASSEETSFSAEEDMMASFKALKVGALPKTKAGRKRKPKAVPLTSWQAWADSSTIPTLPLAEMRSLLFRRQEDMFDRFASPIHFFRSPHAQLLMPQQPVDSALDRPDYAVDIETQMSLSHFESFIGGGKAVELGTPELTRCRSYARVYPQAGAAKVSLPSWNITTGEQSPLHDQAAELSKVLRRSIARHTMKSQTGRTRAHEPLEKQYYAEYAESRVLFDSHAESGLWSRQLSEAGGPSQVADIGSWMKQCLAPEFS
ncbi:alpha/beta-hydrolase [Didymella exigua CBS 183.55]|uniref:Alpha/beta-hydrolase n=1 Tax=Didymella exigua CBS 183.55 TaxID=1150837 RepID=A0A6A5RD04_9PLEO|nr:alpha/beta-hydrolase [Didymella exigua CBS 183.55]KAF1925088.1 alpha/beta-hydrolase [Didymella exigua CBS 183.55]